MILNKQTLTNNIFYSENNVAYTLDVLLVKFSQQIKANIGLPQLKLVHMRDDNLICLKLKL